MSKALQNIVLSFPSPVSGIDLSTGAVRRSWMQVAKIGQWVSQRYGKFSITTDDLKTMLKNFSSVTPISPTKLPVDYDHLSMDPKKVGDGAAAGWIHKLELRDGESTLWADVEWTPDGATRIDKKEYQYVSPSFVKDYTYKDGKNIGTTLLAAALTNHPFLEGMAAVTLSNGAMEFAMRTDVAIHLAEVGQRVLLKPEVAQAMGAQPDTPLEVVQAIGEGDTAFVQLKGPDGAVLGWYRAVDLAPAPAADPNADPNAKPPVVPGDGQPNAPGAPPAPKTPGGPGAQPGIGKPGDPGAPGAPGVHVHLPQQQQMPHPVHIHMSDRPGGKSMKVFTLSDVDGKEVKLSSDVLAAIAKELVPEGSQVIETVKLEDLTGKVTNLSTQVETMKTEAVEKHKADVKAAVDAGTKALMREGRIVGTQRDYALKNFGDKADLVGYHEWVQSLPAAGVIKLDTVHGTGEGEGGADAKKAEGELMTLAHQIEKDQKVSLSVALNMASKQRPELVEKYREQFGTSPS